MDMDQSNLNDFGCDYLPKYELNIENVELNVELKAKINEIVYSAFKKLPSKSFLELNLKKKTKAYFGVITVFSYSHEFSVFSEKVELLDLIKDLVIQLQDEISVWHKGRIFRSDSVKEVAS